MKFKQIYKVIKKNAKAYWNSDTYRAKIYYAKQYDKIAVDANKILIESYLGVNVSGNPYYLLKELKNKEQYKITVVGEKAEKRNIESYLLKKGYTNLNIVEKNSKQYVKALLESAFLINNVTFPTYFIKKENQTYLNTWHGTPLKSLGKSMLPNAYSIGNVQRNFNMADYIIAPNEFTKEIIEKDYMIQNTFDGEYVYSGYPRNSVFFEEDQKSCVRRDMNLVNKKVYVYMPTWREDEASSSDENLNNLLKYLYELDDELNQEEVLYVKPHSFVKSEIPYGEFKNIQPFPEKYETYEFLAVADVLITDYSSVMFDFMCTNKKIVLFTYDEEKYLLDRGMYKNLKDLPFEFATDSNDLIKAIRSNENITYNILKKELCEYDNVNSSKKLIEYIFEKKNHQIKIERNKVTTKEEVLIFGGGLMKNGITTSLKGLLNHVDVKERQYTLLFYANAGARNLKVLHELPQGINYIPIQGGKVMTVCEVVAHFMCDKLKMVDNHIVNKMMNKVYERECIRLFGRKKFAHVVHFSGYEYKTIKLFSAMKDTKKTIFIHNDMFKESETKSNYNTKVVFGAYKTFDNVVCVRDGLVENIRRMVPDGQKEKVKTVHNINNIEGIKLMASKPLKFDEETYTNITIEELTRILENDKYNKFINIGRFSAEKGHSRLIEAFNNSSTSDDYLIIIGGYDLNGVLAKLEQQVKELDINNVIIIKSLNNPFPILSRCDGMVMSSFYEGLPMTIMESLILQVPVVSTRIEGPAEFLEKGFGMLVDNSVEGLEKAFTFIKEGKRGDKEFDAEKFNKQAISEFESLFEE